MRKLIIGLAMLFFAQFSFGQAVSDNAVIPISVTLNSILRLNVVSGGNIQFVVNTISDYTSGLSGDQYKTTFNVASSRTFEVTLAAEGANLIGTDSGEGMLVDNVGYLLINRGDVVPIPADIQTDAKALEANEHNIVASSAGGTADHEYDIMWRLGTTEGDMNEDNLLTLNYPADNYVTNVFLNIVATEIP